MWGVYFGRRSVDTRGMYLSNEQNFSSRIPTIVVVMGATGDLMTKKITPALFGLFRKGALPAMFRVVGFARRDLTHNEFQERGREILENYYPREAHTKAARDFLGRYFYERGMFERKKDYERLKRALGKIDDEWGMCSNKIFYLAVPPRRYPEIANHLAATGLSKPCGGPDEGWTRVIVEKPFGSDEKSAKALDALLGKLFREEQIYRIDHYLAKEMLQNILTFRFANNLFETNWGGNLIERMHIKLLESIGVEDRGGFYDGVGALRDVGQNHLLQMLALVTMERPETFSASAIRAARARILETLEIPSAKDVRNNTFRAQYEGYRAIKGVASNSNTETYFKVRARLRAPRWRGVPITMESGKRMGKPLKEIEIVFRHPSPCLCPEGETHYANSLVIHLEPKEGITIRFWSKKPGHTMELERRTFDFAFREKDAHSQYTEEYEKLLLDCIADDQTLFVSSEEIKAMWNFIDPIVAGWEKGAVPLVRYVPGSADISEHAEEAIRSRETSGRITTREIGVVGLGKMGSGIALQLVEKGWKIHAWNRTPEVTRRLAREGLHGVYSIKELVAALPAPRVVWLMVPSFAKAANGKPEEKPVDEMLFGKEGLARFLKQGDIVVDGGNSFFEDSVRRAARLKKLGIRFVDAGVSGGPWGARHGASIMVGGEKKDFEYLKPLLENLSVRGGYGYMGKSGAGHFVKMVHNGIEYGMMQSLAEGFSVIKKSKLVSDLREVARVYGNGSVITSRLVDWLQGGLAQYGTSLRGVSGSVAHTGEGEWTVKTAKKLKVQTPVIKDAFDFRVRSAAHPSYTGQILSMLRNQFGGHSLISESGKKKKRKRSGNRARGTRL